MFIQNHYDPLIFSLTSISIAWIEIMIEIWFLTTMFQAVMVFPTLVSLHDKNVII